MALSKQDRKLRIKRRIRKVVNGTSERPRLSVFRSNANITAQLIDDTKAITLASASTQLKEIAGESGTKSEKAALVGKKIAALALEKGIDKVVFDRNGLIYHGRIKSLAEAAREAGLKF